MYFLTVWRLKVQGQGVSRVGFTEALFSFLVDGHVLPVSSHGLSSVPICVLISPLYKDSSLDWIRA